MPFLPRNVKEEKKKVRRRSSTRFGILKITHSFCLIWIHDELISWIWLFFFPQPRLPLCMLDRCLEYHWTSRAGEDEAEKKKEKSTFHLHQIKHYQYSGENCFSASFERSGKIPNVIEFLGWSSHEFFLVLVLQLSWKVMKILRLAISCFSREDLLFSSLFLFFCLYFEILLFFLFISNFC